VIPPIVGAISRRTNVAEALLRNKIWLKSTLWCRTFSLEQSGVWVKRNSGRIRVSSQGRIGLPGSKNLARKDTGLFLQIFTTSVGGHFVCVFVADSCFLGCHSVYPHLVFDIPLLCLFHDLPFSQFAWTLEDTIVYYPNSGQFYSCLFALIRFATSFFCWFVPERLLICFGPCADSFLSSSLQPTTFLCMSFLTEFVALVNCFPNLSRFDFSVSQSLFAPLLHNSFLRAPMYISIPWDVSMIESSFVCLIVYLLSSMSTHSIVSCLRTWLAWRIRQIRFSLLLARILF